MKHSIGILLGLMLIACLGWRAQAQDDAYTFSAGPTGWGTSSGMGLIGMAAEVEQQALGLEVFLGIGTNRVQGWALWPRVYLAGETWRPFGELPLVQISETEIQIDPDRGLIKNVYTFQFIGIGLGVGYTQADRTLRLSIGLGATSGQCIQCDVQGYAALHIGFSF